MAPRRVLILSFEEDFHAYAIQALLRKHDADADVVDTGAFPTSLDLAFGGPDLTDIRLGEHRLLDYHSVWYRRARLPKPSTEIANTDERQFAARECEQALWGALYAGGIPIYNRPEFERVANFKPFQLKTALSLGL